jgi:hypothetical protein
MKVWLLITVLLAVSACSSMSVRCGGRLTPINAPAPSDGQAHSRDLMKPNDSQKVSP